MTCLTFILQTILAMLLCKHRCYNLCRDSADRKRLAISMSELVSMLEVSLHTRLLKIESSMEFLSVWNCLEVIESGDWNSPVY